MAEVSPELVALALAAVAVFWMVGAYNRLMRLRGAIGQAFVQVDEVLQRRAAAALQLAAALREVLPSEEDTLQALAVGLARVGTAADVVRQRPSFGPAVQALAAAQAEAGAALTRACALVELRPELAADGDIAPLMSTLSETAARLAFTRQLFNDAVAAYNEAIGLFPTSLLAPVYRLSPAASL